MKPNKIEPEKTEVRRVKKKLTLGQSGDKSFEEN